MTSSSGIMTSYFFSKYRYFKKTWGSHFCWHHQNYNQVLLKKSLNTQEKLKEFEIMPQNATYICISEYKKFADFW